MNEQEETRERKSKIFVKPKNFKEWANNFGWSCVYLTGAAALVILTGIIAAGICKLFILGWNLIF